MEISQQQEKGDKKVLLDLRKDGVASEKGG